MTTISDYLSNLTATWSAVFHVLGPHLTVLWAQPKMRYGLLLLAVGVVVMVVWRPGTELSKRSPVTQRVHARRHTATPLLVRLGTWLHPPQVAWAIGHIVTTARWLPHAIVLGAPGSGKSTMVAARILDEPVGLPGLIWKCRGRPLRKRRGMLVITGNFSGPFRAATLCLLEQGYRALIWTPDGGWGLDVLEGPADSAAKRVMAMHTLAIGDTGLRRGAVEALLQEALETLDARKTPRSFEAILDIMPWVRHAAEKRGELTQNTRNGLDDWTTRVRTLKRTFGDSIGNDVRLSTALADGWTVLIELSSYKDPTQTEALARFFVEYAKYLVASQGRFDLILDEVGAVDPKTYSELLSATRAPEVRIVMCGQSPSQFEDSMREMCSSVLLLGIAAAAPEARRWASRVVDEDVAPEDFILLSPARWFEHLVFWRKRQGLRSLEGYLLSSAGHLDRVRTRPMNLNILARWPKGSVPQGLGTLASPDGKWAYADGATWPTGAKPDNDAVNVDDARIIVVEQPKVVVGPAMLPAPAGITPPSFCLNDGERLDVWNMLEGREYATRCWRWTGRRNAEGYGLASVRVGGRRTSRSVHVAMWLWSQGLSWEDWDRKRASVQATIEHDCHTKDPSCSGGSTCLHRRCGNPAHLYLLSRGTNTGLANAQRRARAQRAGVAVR